MKTILVTGSAGFIVSNLVKRLFHEMNAASKREERNIAHYPEREQSQRS